MGAQVVKPRNDTLTSMHKLLTRITQYQSTSTELYTLADATSSPLQQFLNVFFPGLLGSPLFVPGRKPSHTGLYRLPFGYQARSLRYASLGRPESDPYLIRALLRPSSGVGVVAKAGGCPL